MIYFVKKGQYHSKSKSSYEHSSFKAYTNYFNLPSSTGNSSTISINLGISSGSGNIPFLYRVWGQTGKCKPY